MEKMNFSYNSTEWYFTTLTAPFFTDTDGPHPVSGNRAFGIKWIPGGGYTLYTRGVDRVTLRVSEIVGNNNPFMDNVFEPADNLWTAFQDNLVDFIQNNGGQAIKLQVEPERVKWEAVQTYLMGNG